MHLTSRCPDESVAAFSSTSKDRAPSTGVNLRCTGQLVQLNRQ